MNHRVLAGVAAVLAAVFLVLNLTVDGAGPLFLLLAIAAAIGCGLLLTPDRQR